MTALASFRSDTNYQEWLPARRGGLFEDMGVPLARPIPVPGCSWAVDVDVKVGLTPEKLVVQNLS